MQQDEVVAAGARLGESLWGSALVQQPLELFGSAWGRLADAVGSFIGNSTFLRWPAALGLPLSDIDTVGLQTPSLESLVSWRQVFSFERMATSLAVAAGLTGIYTCLFYVFRPRFKERARTLSFTCTAFLSLLYMSSIGNLWYFCKPTMPDPVFGFEPSAYHLAQFMIGYQIFNTGFVCSCEEAFQWIIVAHHAFTATLAVLSMFRFSQGYAYFFFGVVETSSLFLGMVDFHEYGRLTETYPTTALLSKGLFAISFFVFRVFLWVKPTVSFWQDMFARVLLDEDRNQSTLTVAAAVFFLVASATLTLLQAYWAKVVVDNVAGVFRRASKGGDDSSSTESTIPKQMD